MLTTVGLRQPLLMHDVRSPGNRVLQCGVAHAPRVVRETHLRNDSISVRRTAAPRAAGVSPPWWGKRIGDGERFSARF
jgi:hypothetical protein